jgi:hypothetical protein
MINSNEKVIVVGNGPSVLGSGLGKFIDSFDHVVRFNNFAIKGFEKDVGTKTTLWATHGVDQHPIGCDSLPDQMLLVPYRKTTYNIKKIWSVDRSFYDLTRDRIKAFSSWPEEEKHNLLCSTGVTTICWLLHKYNLKNINAVGFDHFSKITTSAHHYWNNKKFLKPREHDGESEHLLLEMCYPNRVMYVNRCI